MDDFFYMLPAFALWKSDFKIILLQNSQSVPKMLLFRTSTIYSTAEYHVGKLYFKWESFIGIFNGHPLRMFKTGEIFLIIKYHGFRISQNDQLIFPQYNF